VPWKGMSAGEYVAKNRFSDSGKGVLN